MNKKIIFITLFIFGLFFISGCNKNIDSFTYDKFKSSCDKLDYIITDSSSSVTDNNDKVKNVYLANKGEIQLEFYIFKSESDAKDVFELDKQVFKEFVTSTSKEEDIKEKKYRVYSLITSSEYMYVKQIKDTLISLRCPVEYYNDARELIKSLEE